MRKATQNLLLVMIGVALLHITVISGDYVNYVRPAFQIMLIGAAAVIVLLGVVGFWIETRDLDHDDGDRRAEQENHHGARAPRTAWLLFLPILGIFLVAPPALGSFTASRAATRTAPAAPPPPQEGYAPLPDGPPVVMSISDYVGRAYAPQIGRPATLPGHQVVLTGFVMPGPGSAWYLTRMRIACCAADAIAMQVIVRGAPMPPKDAWVQVTGMWGPPATTTTRTVFQPIMASSVRRIPKPPNTYE
ncbi:MAG TPA: TIGR03943 family protein [Streptosporangiaceae bacterium]|jgi:uncharacterized repeat protein (TIGR03943 family)|nr:TIGR03943 family protein [Streptosporangiaceae bacterium]